EPAKFVPGRPMWDQKRVRDQHARRPGMSPEDPDRLAALHEECLVVAEAKQRRDDRPERGVVTRSLARASVDDQLLRKLGDLGVEVVEQHAQRRLGGPGSGVEVVASRSADPRQVAAESLDSRVERVDRRHWPRSCSALRLSRHHVHAFAATKKAAAANKALAKSPPVIVAITTIRIAIAP